MAEALKKKRKKSESRKSSQSNSSYQESDTKPIIKYDVDARNDCDLLAATEPEQKLLAPNEEFNSQSEPVAKAQLTLEQPDFMITEPARLTEDCPLTTESEYDSISGNSHPILDDSLVYAIDETDNQERTPKQPTNGKY